MTFATFLASITSNALYIKAVTALGLSGATTGGQMLVLSAIGLTALLGTLAVGYVCVKLCSMAYTKLFGSSVKLPKNKASAAAKKSTANKQPALNKQKSRTKIVFGKKPAVKSDSSEEESTPPAPNTPKTVPLGAPEGTSTAATTTAATTTTTNSTTPAPTGSPAPLPKKRPSSKNKGVKAAPASAPNTETVTTTTASATTTAVTTTASSTTAAPATSTTSVATTGTESTQTKSTAQPESSQNSGLLASAAKAARKLAKKMKRSKPVNTGTTTTTETAPVAPAANLSALPPTGPVSMTGEPQAPVATSPELNTATAGVSVSTTASVTTQATVSSTQAAPAEGTAAPAQAPKKRTDESFVDYLNANYAPPEGMTEWMEAPAGTNPELTRYSPVDEDAGVYYTKPPVAMASASAAASKNNPQPVVQEPATGTTTAASTVTSSESAPANSAAASNGSVEPVAQAEEYVVDDRIALYTKELSALIKAFMQEHEKNLRNNPSALQNQAADFLGKTADKIASGTNEATLVLAINGQDQIVPVFLSKKEFEIADKQNKIAQHFKLIVSMLQTLYPETAINGKSVEPSATANATATSPAPTAETAVPVPMPMPVPAPAAETTTTVDSSASSASSAVSNDNSNAAPTTEAPKGEDQPQAEGSSEGEGDTAEESTDELSEQRNLKPKKRGLLGSAVNALTNMVTFGGRFSRTPKTPTPNKDAAQPTVESTAAPAPTTTVVDSTAAPATSVSPEVIAQATAESAVAPKKSIAAALSMPVDTTNAAPQAVESPNTAANSASNLTMDLGALFNVSATTAAPAENPQSSDVDRTDSEPTAVSVSPSVEDTQLAALAAYAARLNELCTILERHSEEKFGKSNTAGHIATALKEKMLKAKQGSNFVVVERTKIGFNFVSRVKTSALQAIGLQENEEAFALFERKALAFEPVMESLSQPEAATPLIPTPAAVESATVSDAAPIIPAALASDVSEVEGSRDSASNNAIPNGLAHLAVIGHYIDDVQQFSSLALEKIAQGSKNSKTIRKAAAQAQVIIGEMESSNEADTIPVLAKLGSVSFVSVTRAEFLGLSAQYINHFEEFKRRMKALHPNVLAEEAPAVVPAPVAVALESSAAAANTAEESADEETVVQPESPDPVELAEKSAPNLEQGESSADEGEEEGDDEELDPNAGKPETEDEGDEGDDDEEVDPNANADADKPEADQKTASTSEKPTGWLASLAALLRKTPKAAAKPASAVVLEKEESSEEEEAVDETTVTASVPAPLATPPAVTTAQTTAQTASVTSEKEEEEQEETLSEKDVAASTSAPALLATPPAVTTTQVPKAEETVKPKADARVKAAPAPLAKTPIKQDQVTTIVAGSSASSSSSSSSSSAAASAANSSVTPPKSAKNAGGCNVVTQNFGVNNNKKPRGSKPGSKSQRKSKR